MPPEPLAVEEAPLVESGPPRGRAAVWRGLLRQREVMTIVLILATSLVFHMLTLSPKPETWPSKFANTSHLLTFVVPISSEAIIAVGMLLVIVSGGFDLSVGSVLALSEIAAAATVRALVDKTNGMLPPYAIPLAFAAGIGVGLVTGLINATIITRFDVNPLIATLGTMSIARGIAKWVIAKYSVIADLPNAFTAIGGSQLALGSHALVGYQIFLAALVVIIVGDVLMRNSRVFRQIYYVGGNETAARLSGINVERVRGMSYILCGCLAGLAGVLSVSRWGNANGDSGVGLELQAIAGCVIGGASLAGGVGSAMGAVLGCVLMNVVYKGLVCCNVDPSLQTAARGLVLVAAVTLDMWVVRRRKRR